MSLKPERIQRKRTAGWKLPPNTVVVTRPGKFGNPFRVGGYFMIGDPGGPEVRLRMSMCEALAGYQDDRFTLIETNEQAVEFYREYLKRYPLGPTAIQELRGKNLACWCPLTDTKGNRVPCHADVLLEMANSGESDGGEATER